MRVLAFTCYQVFLQQCGTRHVCYAEWMPRTRLLLSGSHSFAMSTCSCRHPPATATRVTERAVVSFSGSVSIYADLAALCNKSRVDRSRRDDHLREMCRQNRSVKLRPKLYTSLGHCMKTSSAMEESCTISSFVRPYAN